MSQRKALAEQLEEVEKLQNEGEISQDLREKLEDIEKEYENLAGESARAFLPKQKAPNVEDSLSSLHVLEGRSGKVINSYISLSTKYFLTSNSAL